MEKNIVGQKHIVNCRCILPQFKKSGILHSFIVFSIIENDIVQEKIVNCNNCGAQHRVFDICKSEILNTDSTIGTLTIEEIKLSISNKNIITIFENNKCDLPTWENLKFILDNQLWGCIITMSSEFVDGYNIGKYIQILGENLYKVESFSIKGII